MLKEYAPPQSRIDQKFARKWARTEIAEVDERIGRVAESEDYALMKPYLGSGEIKRLMDAGCGAGEWDVFLAKQGIEVTGVDIDAETIEKLKTVSPEVTWVAGDFRQDIGLPKHSFDGVLSIGSYEHTEEGIQIPLRATTRLLRTGGYLFLSTPFHNFHLNFFPMTYPGYRRGEFYQYRYTRADVEHELVARGFEVLESRLIHQHHGIRRFVRVSLGVQNRRMQKRLGWWLKLILPKRFLAHMLFTISRKVEDVEPGS